MKTIYHDFFPEDLLPSLEECKIDYTIVVQATPSIEETEFLLKLHNQYDFIKGVVGWLDLKAVNFEAQFLKFKNHKGFVGVRPTFQDILDGGSIVKQNIRVLHEENFPIDLLVFPSHLPFVYQLLEEFPNLNVVINHAANPDIKSKELEPWKTNIKNISNFPNIMCKLSGLITRADFDEWRIEQIYPYVHHVFNTFGSNNVMFGSDWPVCLQAGLYQDTINVLFNNLNDLLTKNDKLRLLGANAIDFYNLDVS